MASREPSHRTGTTGDAGRKRRVTSIVSLTMYILAGPLIWAAQFSILYGLHTWACVISPAAAARDGWLLPALTATTIAALAAALAILVRGRRIQRGLSGDGDEAGLGPYVIVSNVLLILSVIAIAWSGLTLGLLKAC